MKMIFEILILIIVIATLLLFFYPAGILTAPVSQYKTLSSVCAGENCFQVELATTAAERDRGLMYRKELDKDKGMLFVFDKEGIYPFWMKNTLIPLDMIWMDSAGKAVFMSENVQPCKSLICPSVVPSAKAKYVLEINAGQAQKTGLKTGDSLELKIVN